MNSNNKHVFTIPDLTTGEIFMDDQHVMHMTDYAVDLHCAKKLLNALNGKKLILRLPFYADKIVYDQTSGKILYDDKAIIEFKLDHDIYFAQWVLDIIKTHSITQDMVDEAAKG